MIHGPQPIVTNGLVLALDAANKKSYISGSTTWNDLSGNGNNGTLVNGPTFSSENGGSIVFDGTNDYVTLINNTSSSFTLGCWVNTTATSLTGGAAYEGNGILWSDVGGPGNDFILATINNTAVWFTGDTNNQIAGTTIINTGKWVYITAIKNGNTNSKQLYVNTLLEGTTTCSTASLTANPNIRIGGNTLDSRYFNGKISNVHIYNKALSSSEVLQNYNALKSRFNLN